MASNFSNHLKLLCEAGLVETESCGRFTYYWLRPEVLERDACACGDQETLFSKETSAPAEADVLHRLSFLDRFLPVWIGLAMVVGLVLGRFVPGLEAVKIGEVSLPIALGLLLTMYPVLAKVRYDCAYGSGTGTSHDDLAGRLAWSVPG